MRINVYPQELTDDVELVSKTSNTGKTYYGVRLYLKSPDELHHTPTDDERSAITFWLPSGNTHGRAWVGTIFGRMYDAIYGVGIDSAAEVKTDGAKEYVDGCDMPEPHRLALCDACGHYHWGATR